MDKNPKMGGQNYDLKSIRNYKDPVPSFLPNEDNYKKFGDMLSPDERDLKQ